LSELGGFQQSHYIEAPEIIQTSSNIKVHISVLRRSPKGVGLGSSMFSFLLLRAAQVESTLAIVKVLIWDSPETFSGEQCRYTSRLGAYMDEYQMVAEGLG